MPSCAIMAVPGWSKLGAVTTASTDGIRPSVGCTTSAMREAACSVTSTSVGATIDAVGSANAALTSASLLPKTGVMAGDAVYPA